MKTALIISYHFAPDIRVGGRRAAKFARYLPESGWKPIVLTVDPRFYPGTDDAEPPAGLIVERTRTLPSLLDVYRWFKALLGRSGAAADCVEHSGANGEAEGASRSSLLRNLSLALMFLPDEHVQWLPFAVARGLAIASRQRIDAIISTSPPNSAQLVGSVLHALTGIPWLADLRDPWINEAQPDYRQTVIARFLNSNLERAALAGANRVVCVTDEMNEYYRGMFPGGERRFEAICNGYEPTDFPAAPASNDPLPLRIAHLGSFYRARDPRCLLEAAGGLLRRGEVIPSELRLEFIGQCDRTPSGPMAGLVAANGLEHVVDVVGWLPHGEALKRMQRADAALVLAPRQKLQVPAKLFEYIGAAKPVLALTEPDSATGRLVVRARCGQVVDQDDVEGIEQVLKHLLDQKRHGVLDYSPDEELVGQLDVRRQTERLARILNGMIRD